MASSKKGAQHQERQIVFLDEVGFYPLPTVLTTWAPIGQTPLLVAPWTRDHVSAIGAVTPEGAMTLHSQQHSIHDKDVVHFLKHLQQLFGAKLLVFWDGGTIHRSRVVQDYLNTDAAAGIRIAALPAYAPELNPTEGLWSYQKQVALGDTVHSDLDQLEQDVRRTAKQIQNKPQIVRSFFEQAGLYKRT